MPFEECDFYQCYGSIDQICGGYYQISIFNTFKKLNSTDDITIASKYYLGCFPDYPVNRDLSHQFWNTSKPMTIDYCINYCLNLNYSLAGLQAG